MKQVDLSEYLEAVESYQGYCTKCKDFTRDCTEPDAEGYDCPECDSDTVVGAEQAIFLGLIGLVS